MNEMLYSYAATSHQPTRSNLWEYNFIDSFSYLWRKCHIFSCMPPTSSSCSCTHKNFTVFNAFHISLFPSHTIYFSILSHRICHSSFITNYAYRIAGEFIVHHPVLGTLHVEFLCLREKYANTHTHTQHSHIPFARSRAASNFSKQIPHNFQYFSISLTLSQSSLSLSGIGVASFCLLNCFLVFVNTQHTHISATIYSVHRG